MSVLGEENTSREDYMHAIIQRKFRKSQSQAQCFGRQPSQGTIAKNDIFCVKIICLIIKLIHASLYSIG